MAAAYVLLPTVGSCDSARSRPSHRGIAVLETVSAIATVGLSTDTSQMRAPDPDRLMFGRLGALTLATEIALRDPMASSRLPEGRPIWADSACADHVVHSEQEMGRRVGAALLGRRKGPARSRLGRRRSSPGLLDPARRHRLLGRARSVEIRWERQLRTRARSAGCGGARGCGAAPESIARSLIRSISRRTRP